jgi:urea transport system substrate-binding protein
MKIAFNNVSQWCRLACALVVTLVVGCGTEPETTQRFTGEVKVGILHSRTGSLAISENTVAEAELLAIAEINAAGGIKIGNQRLKVVPVEEDGQSDWPTFARLAERLIDVDQVAVVFGGWTSSSRKEMLPVFESRDHLLFYPIQYEGEECSKNIFYAGATPNQQAEPAVNWLLENRGKQFFLLGSDYVYPRTVNRIIKAQLAHSGAQLLGEVYIPFGDKNMQPVIDEIAQAMPQGGVIINTINGDSNVAFFEAAYAAGITHAAGYSIMSFSVSEEEVFVIGPKHLERTLASWSFFQSLETKQAQKFTADFRAMHGVHRVTNDPAETAYNMVHIWALAAVKANSVDPSLVRVALPGTAFQGPGGYVEVEPNHHLKKNSLIGELQADGQFKIIHDAGIIEPRVWSQWLPENKGYLADWTIDRPDAGRFKPSVSAEQVEKVSK